MSKKTLAFLTEKANIVKFLFFVTIFASIFISVYKPFGGTKIWQELIGKQTPLLYMSFIIVIGFIVLIISRIALYLTQKKFSISYLYYIFWMIAEISLITFICTLTAWLINEQHTYFYKILPRTFYYTISILSIPYIIFWLYFSLKENEKILKQITDDESFDEEMNSSKDMINFKDEKGNLRLSVKMEHLYYLESANNYIYIYYENSKKELTKCILRSSLKIIEKTYQDIGLIRCHKRYIINFKKVKILKRIKEGLMLELDFEGISEIPVSKTYVDEIIALFSKYSIS